MPFHFLSLFKQCRVKQKTKRRQMIISSVRCSSTTILAVRIRREQKPAKPLSPRRRDGGRDGDGRAWLSRGRHGIKRGPLPAVAFAGPRRALRRNVESHPRTRFNAAPHRPRAGHGSRAILPLDWLGTGAANNAMEKVLPLASPWGPLPAVIQLVECHAWFFR
jgi:hypothetical protein